jgi:hypothetical protein
MTQFGRGWCGEPEAPVALDIFGTVSPPNAPLHGHLTGPQPWFLIVFDASRYYVNKTQ